MNLHQETSYDLNRVVGGDAVAELLQALFVSHKRQKIVFEIQTTRHLSILETGLLWHGIWYLYWVSGIRFTGGVAFLR